MIYELRTMSKAGYQPDLLSCSSCGKYEGGEFYLDPVEGNLLCAECADKARHIPNLDPGALYALRYICLAEDQKVFSFTLSPTSLKNLSRVSELAGASGTRAEKPGLFKNCTGIRRSNTPYGYRLQDNAGTG